jgi:hypothetical protein
MKTYDRVLSMPTEKELLKAEIAYKQDILDTWHKDQSGDGPWRRYRNLLMLKEILSVFPPDQYRVCGHPAGVIIDNKWIVTLLSKKWRVNGKNKWYRLKSFEEFRDRFVNKSKEQKALNHLDQDEQTHSD